MKYVHKFFKIGVATERILLFSVIFILLIHNCTCFWVLVGQLEEAPDSWVYQNGFQDLNNTDLYVASFYFVITTIATVGYGDISPYSTIERIFGIFLMILGVVGFSIATGALSSLMTSLDSMSAKLKQKMDYLDQIKREYNLNPLLYEEIRQAIKFEVEKDKSNLIKFVDKLPH